LIVQEMTEKESADHQHDWCEDLTIESISPISTRRYKRCSICNRREMVLDTEIEE